MSELTRYQEEYKRPWGMPANIFWDITEGATIRRGQWVVDNNIDVPIEKIAQQLVMQPDEVAKLDLSCRIDYEKGIDWFENW